MSSIQDIMSVDVEPFESYTRARQAAEQQASLPSVETNSAASSPTLDLDDIQGRIITNRRRSHRVSKTSRQSTLLRLSSTRRHSSPAAEAMDYSGYQAGGSNQASTAGSPQQSSSRGSEPTADFPVKYTPITGRISRAKKGVPVHTCDICRPVRTFTRAEHLRRHKLSHQKPAYPCTFRDCERAFHRPDLLSRHLHRHETQGEKPYKSPGGRRPSSSPSMGRRTPPLKLEPPAQVQQTQAQGDESTSATQPSPTDSDSITPRTTASNTDGAMTAFTTPMGNFQAINYSPGSSHKRTASDAQLSGSDPYSAISPTARPPPNYDHLSGFPSNSGLEMSNQNEYGRSGQQNYPSLQFTNYNTPIHTPISLPLLRIPDGPYPGLSYTQDNSPFCSSASDSTYSTQSNESRTGRNYSRNGRARSQSINNTPDCYAPYPPLPSHGILGTHHASQFESMLDQFEPPFSSPGMNTPLRSMFEIPSAYGGIQYIDTSVGISALPTYTKPIAQNFPASPARSNESAMVENSGRKKMQPTRHAIASALQSSHPQQQQQGQSSHLDPYIETYWESFHQLFPIVHRGTFVSTDDMLLSSAMAAIGTQYHGSTQARQKGMELNEYCKKSIDLCTTWTFPTQQAILLTEIFARFRGRKTRVSLSRQFEELYNRLCQNATQEQAGFPCQGSSHSTVAELLLDRFSPHPSTPQQSLQPDLQAQWQQWVETESKQRLLALCFMYDVHQSMYHEQSRSKPQFDTSLICLPCPDNLWDANSALEWKVQQAGYSVQHLDLVEQDFASQHFTSRSPLAQSLLICNLAIKLPRDDPTYHPSDFLPDSIHPAVTDLSRVFPNSPLVHTYLALHYTPLQDLLAIAGDTWVFARKITPPSAFHDAQRRLKTWSLSLAAAAATQHACRLLQDALASEAGPRLVDQPGEPYTGGQYCITDYWAIYISALICWAFGHRQYSSGTVSRNSPVSAINNSNMDIDSPQTPVDESKLKALSYTTGILSLSTEDLLMTRLRGDTSGLIDAVKARLEIDGTGSKCSTIVDAIQVLTRIKEGRRSRARFF